jgi:hypothetical protein
MQALRNRCFPWLNWKVAAALSIVLAGMVLCADWSSWGMWVGATPLLTIVVCLLPCLIPLVLLPRKGGDRGSAQPK